MPHSIGNLPVRQAAILALLLLVIFSLLIEICRPELSPLPKNILQLPLPTFKSQSPPQETTNADRVEYKSQVGKVHALFGDHPFPTYERALERQRIHGEQNGHPLFVLRNRILRGLWSKPAFLLSTILQELERPREERLRWLLWSDADTVLMNPSIPIDIFVPPSPAFDFVNLMLTNDHKGLNNGVFLIKVNAWSVRFLSAVLAFHGYNPEVKLKYSEQSAMEEVIELNKWKRNVVHVPQVWFNAYAPHANDSAEAESRHFRPGGLQVHFARKQDGLRMDRMNEVMQLYDEGPATFNVPLEHTWYMENITAFWSKLEASMLEGAKGKTASFRERLLGVKGGEKDTEGAKGSWKES